jgi:hypothetical protein
MMAPGVQSANITIEMGSDEKYSSALQPIPLPASPLYYYYLQKDDHLAIDFCNDHYIKIFEA